jgi:hypothetical protein
VIHDRLPGNPVDDRTRVIPYHPLEQSLIFGHLRCPNALFEMHLGVCQEYGQLRTGKLRLAVDLAIQQFLILGQTFQLPVQNPRAF